MLKQQSQDLARQVQHLLKSQLDRATGRSPLSAGGSSSSLSTPLSARRGGARMTSPAGQLAVYGSPAAADAQGVVTEHLTTFSDIADMQQKNMQQLATIRTLTRDLEGAHRDLADAKSGGMFGAAGGEGGSSGSESELAALRELEAMRESRKRQEDMVQAIVQQRDMYRVLLAQADGRYAGEGADGSAAAPLAIAAATSPQGGRADPSAQAELARMRDEVGGLQKELAREKEGNSLLRDAQTGYQVHATNTFSHF